jgi:hypothetical protein
MIFPVFHCITASAMPSAWLQCNRDESAYSTGHIHRLTTKRRMNSTSKTCQQCQKQRRQKSARLTLKKWQKLSNQTEPPLARIRLVCLHEIRRQRRFEICFKAGIPGRAFQHFNREIRQHGHPDAALIERLQYRQNVRPCLDPVKRIHHPLHFLLGEIELQQHGGEDERIFRNPLEVA